MEQKKSSSANAFTLIELLVVIVIVSILAGLLYSVLGSVKENAKSAQCMSNMRQIFSALNLYAQDHGNMLPQRRYPGFDENGQVIGYPEVILKYVDQGGSVATSESAKKLYTCPSQSKPDYPSEPGYGMNWYYDNANLAQVPLPSQTILLSETLGNLGNGSRRANRDNASNDIGKLDIKRHRGKANYVFFDGHLSSMTYDDTRKAVTPAQGDPPPDLWGVDHNDHAEPAPTPPY